MADGSDDLPSFNFQERSLTVKVSNRNQKILEDILCSKYGCQISFLPSQHKNEPSFLYLER